MLYTPESIGEKFIEYIAYLTKIILHHKYVKEFKIDASIYERIIPKKVQDVPIVTIQKERIKIFQ
jgi:hypothetical protein